MASVNPSSKPNMATSGDTTPLEQTPADVAPPVGITPPQILAADAAAGRTWCSLATFVLDYRE